MKKTKKKSISSTVLKLYKLSMKSYWIWWGKFSEYCLGYCHPHLCNMAFKDSTALYITSAFLSFLLPLQSTNYVGWK